MLVAIIAIEGSSSLRNLSCGENNLKKQNLSWWRVIQLTSSFSEVITAMTIIFFACAETHDIEPSFMEPIVSILYWTYSEIRSHHECVVNPNDLSVSLCVIGKWFAFLIFVVRNCKSDVYSVFYGSSTGVGTSPTSSTKVNGRGSSRLFMSPFKRPSPSSRVIRRRSRFGKSETQAQ